MKNILPSCEAFRTLRFDDELIDVTCCLWADHEQEYHVDPKTGWRWRS